MDCSSLAVAAGAAQMLRHHTRAAHDAVEALPLMRDLGAGDVDAADYAQILHRHHAALAGWEQALQPWLLARVGQGWHYRWRVPALAADLRALGEKVPVPAPGPVLPDMEAGRWGMLYVVEGSQLGGRLIARQLRARQPMLASALAYFELGDSEPAAWRCFQRLLDRALGSVAERTAAIEGANTMFMHFHRSFEAEWRP